MRYFQSTIERLLYILLVVLVVVNVAGGLLIYGVLAKQDRISKAQQQTIASLNTIVKGHTDTLSVINGGFTSLNAKVDCIFQYFTTPNRNANTTITLTPNEKICNVDVNPVTSASGGSTGGTKSSQ